VSRTLYRDCFPGLRLHMRNPIQSGTFVATIILCCVGVLSSSASVGRDWQVKPFDTGITIGDSPSGSATWLDNERLLITALTKGANPHAWPPDTRVVLLNVQNRQVRVIAERARVWSIDEDRTSFMVGPWDKYSGGRRFSVPTEGDVVDQGRIDLAAPLPPKSPYLPCADGRVLCQALERKQDGYLYVDQKTYERKAQQGLGTEIPLMWAQPGKPPITLPLLLNDFARATYLRFLGKYLLEPPMRAPFRLLSLDGSVETIPYPTLGFDAQSELFGQLLVTRAGVVITKGEMQMHGGTLHDSMLLLVPPDRFVTVVKTSSYPNGKLWIFDLSPDGCSIVYSHNTASRLSYLLDSGSSQSLSIVNVCKQK
jgi:hypothetical protein